MILVLVPRPDSVRHWSRILIITNQPWSPTSSLEYSTWCWVPVHTRELWLHTPIGQMIFSKEYIKGELAQVTEHDRKSFTTFGFWLAYVIYNFVATEPCMYGDDVILYCWYLSNFPGKSNTAHADSTQLRLWYSTLVSPLTQNWIWMSGDQWDNLRVVFN